LPAASADGYRYSFTPSAEAAPVNGFASVSSP
jgi:hypothetical protein